jgi:four helix bundle protein
VQLFKDIYTVTDKWPTGTTQVFKLVMDIRRIAMAIPNDITEGINPHHDKESVEFLINAQEGLTTLQNCLLSARDQRDLAKENFSPLLMQIEKINNQIQGLKNSLAGI